MSKQIALLVLASVAYLLGQALATAQTPAPPQAPGAVYNQYTGQWEYPPPPPNPYVVTAAAPQPVVNNYTGAVAVGTTGYNPYTAAAARAAEYNRYTAATT